MKRQHVWMTAALIFFLLFALVPQAATAAIRLTFNEGSTTQVYYTPDSQMSFTTGTVGDYNFTFHITTSNFPGTGGVGSLDQSLNVSTSAGTGTVTPLTITADIIQTVGALSAGFVGSGDLSAVNASPLLRFTDPNNMQLQVLSAGSGSSSNPNSTATIAVATTVDGTTTTTTANIPGGNQTVGMALNTVNGYTLTSQVMISNAAHGVTGLAVTATSAVTALVPEPLSLAIWGIGACGLAMALRWRRKSQVATAA